jgi:ABC-type glycerol-3-phosphate transport system substrate-binding protein
VATRAPGIASRTASLSYALSHNSTFKAPADWLAANRYALSHIEGNAVPSTPAYAPIEEHLGVMLSSLITGQATPKQALASIQSQTAAILAEYHL